MRTTGALNISGYTEDNSKTNDDEVTISFANLIIAFRIFYWIIILTTIVGLIAGFVGSKLFFKPKYSTSAAFTISSSRNSDEDYGFRTTLDDRLITAETYVITSTTLKNMLVDNLDETYEDCSITADEITDTNVVTLNVTADSKGKAYSAVKEVISDFPKISQKIFGDVTVSLLDEVKTSDTPVNSSQRKMIILVGGTAGLLIGLFIILMYSLSLNLVPNAETLQKYVNADCLGQIPLLSSKMLNRVHEITIENRNVPDDYKEGFQFIRTRVERFCEKHNYKTILITSTFPGEGKTTVSINTALSLAQNDKKVIIIDCDLRNPSVAERFGVKLGEYGFNDLLTGRCDFEDVTVRLPKSNVYFISCNRPMGNASEVLQSEIMAETIKKAQAFADYVIIDSPPTDVMGDSIALSKYVDTSIFVVKQNYGRLNNVIYAMEDIKQTNKDFIGFVMNCSYSKLNFFDYSGYGRYNKYGYGRNFENYKQKKN